jgi:cell division protein FtsQ
LTPGNRRISRAAYRQDEVSGGALPAAPSVARKWPSRLFSAVRTGLGIAIVASASLGGGWIARRHVTTSPRFAVTSLQVAGNERRTAEEIIAESGLTVGANIFAVDLDSARAGILADPWVQGATLARRLPGTILIQVSERKPAALVAIDGMFLATSDGEAFKRLGPGDPVDLPLITGLSPERVADDREWARRMIRRGVDVAAEYDVGPLSRRAPLEEVHVDAEGGFTLVVGHAAVQLVLGAPPFRHKLDQAARVLGELEKRNAKAQVVMLDNETRPERVVVRLP